MAFTATIVNKSVLGNRRITVADVNISSYTTGGEAVIPATFNLRSVDAVIPVTDGTTGYQPQYDHTTTQTNNKLLVFQGATQVSNATNIGSVRCVAIGQS